MPEKPYVGVTGITRPEEAEAVADAFASAGYTLASSHMPMMGILVSQDTLEKKMHHNRRYPAVDSLPAILEKMQGKAFPTIHYTTREQSALCRQIETLFNGIYQEGLCKAVQLNVINPDKQQLRMIKEVFPEMKIIFQANETLQARISSILQERAYSLAERVAEYSEFIDYILIDPSGGKDIPLNVGRSALFWNALHEKMPSLTIGFAGGLNAGNVGERAELLYNLTGTKDFSIDTESGVRDKITDKPGDDVLNVEKVNGYIKKAYSVLH